MSELGKQFDETAKKIAERMLRSGDKRIGRAVDEGRADPTAGWNVESTTMRVV